MVLNVRVNRLREKEKRREREEEGRKEEGKCKKSKGMEIVWNLHKFGTFPWYGTTINHFLSKLRRKNPTINVIDWYEMGIMVYFEFWVEMVLV